MPLLDYFREVVIADTEFRLRGDGSQEVRCVCAIELRSGIEHRLWCEPGVKCPYPTDGECAFIAHYASAEALSHLSLGWPLPANVIDTYIEFSHMLNGKLMSRKECGLLAALTYLKLDHIAAEEKDEMRDVVLEDRRNESYSEQERADILEYCFSDCDGVKRLLNSPRMEKYLCKPDQKA